MKQITIADRTLCCAQNSYSFKEKIEIARQLTRLNVNIIELPEIINEKADILLVRTVSAFSGETEISVGAGLNAKSVRLAAKALEGTEKGRIRVELPLSTVGMEYQCHKKAPKMGAFIEELVKAAKENCDRVEFCATDATRADISFVKEMADVAVAAGADCVTVCDSAAELMPDEFAEFAKELAEHIGDRAKVGVMCSDKNGFAAASCVLAIKKGVKVVKAAQGGGIASLETLGEIIKNCGENAGLSSDIKYTELNRIIKQIMRFSAAGSEKSYTALKADESRFVLDEKDDISVLLAAVEKLGYDLSEEDGKKVYEEFKRVAAKKKVGATELEAIVASTALQVEPEYTLVNYVVNSGNVISATAQVTLNRNGQNLQGICIGDGPIDAAFHAIEQITGGKYRLDDFKIQSVTEGKEAVGSAIVRLRSKGKLYSGNGISTDIIDAGIRAYVSAVNKIVYEEA